MNLSTALTDLIGINPVVSCVFVLNQVFHSTKIFETVSVQYQNYGKIGTNVSDICRRVFFEVRFIRVLSDTVLLVCYSSVFY